MVEKIKEEMLKSGYSIISDVPMSDFAIGDIHLQENLGVDDAQRFLESQSEISGSIGSYSQLLFTGTRFQRDSLKSRVTIIVLYYIKGACNWGTLSIPITLDVGTAVVRPF